jgi:hypothetical protein
MPEQMEFTPSRIAEMMADFGLANTHRREELQRLAALGAPTQPDEVIAFFALDSTTTELEGDNDAQLA